MHTLHTESCIISGCSYLFKGLLIELLRLEVEKPCLNSVQADRPQVGGGGGRRGGGPEKLVPREETHLFEVHVQVPSTSTALIGGPAQTRPWGSSAQEGTKAAPPTTPLQLQCKPAGSLLTPSSSGLSSIGTSDCFLCPLSPSLGATTTLSLPQLC